ncbi:S-layer homology domain-containing protein [Oscillatoriales cyanobacterium LEGE 11467]|uniref:S-layer homology domain-containing protein n=1 Tax=Zarconia navalis LEGE 11467 TaxID=1828826 RepID=A0A928W0P1_9CYAN|nr:S-layer homology domain-containing protein [Zarconia navalis]MBE9042347.1 S-layer homology domain-containing protein [Zarconia navalis LEGE 11467]
MFDRAIAMTALCATATSTLAGIPVMLSASATAPTEFSDVKPDYWAYPYITSLAEEEILAGYPDGTFRPEKSIDRDEFAATIRQAFEEETVRQIPEASVFADVPDGNWAEPAIEEAYETGFMEAKEEQDRFFPHQEMTKLEAIAALTRGLELTASPTVAASQTPASTVAPNRRQPKKSKNRLAFPLASTVLLQPFAIPPANAQSNPAPTAQQGYNATAPTTNLGEYYEDAASIPDESIDEVAAATEAGLIANYPTRRILNPNEPLNRGSAAAMLYQTLVYLDRLPALPENENASEYIVAPE